MAELAAIRLALGVAWKLFAPKSASKLERGDVTEEKLRQLLLNEFQKLHEHLNAIRRKELVAAVAFLETGYDLLHKDIYTSREEFRKARDAALMAFGIVPEVCDKILATKILISSAIHEFADNLETAVTLCLKYLTRLNSLPEISKICHITFDFEGTLKSKLLGLTGKTSRFDILQSLADANYCLWEFIIEHQCLAKNNWPRVVWEKGNIHPVYDLCILRSSDLIAELDYTSGTIIATAMCKNYIFAATSQLYSPTDMQNSILVICQETGHVKHLIGHSGNVLSLTSDQTHLFSASYDKTIIVWNPETLECEKILQKHTGAVRSLCISESFLFSASTDSTVCVWFLDSLELCQVIEIGAPISYITCSKKKFLFCITALSKLQIWDVGKLKHEEVKHPNFNMTVTGSVSKLMISENILFACSKGSVDLIKLGSLKKESTINEITDDYILTKSNKFLICKDEDLSLWSTRTGKQVLNQKIPCNGEISIDFIWENNGSLFASYFDHTNKRKFLRKW